MTLSPENEALVERVLGPGWFHVIDSDEQEHINRLLDAAREDGDSALRERLADNAALEWFVYEIFYANPIAFARKNLVIALQRHLLGLPLVTPEEAQRKMLDDMTEEERAEWWRAENARRLSARGVNSA